MLPAPWTPELRDLWDRIQAHPFEDDDDALDLTGRLAREQGWSRPRARDTIDAYRRFCFLAVAAGVPVTPSVDVDEVWHLHLLYTRDYWEVFCPTVLRMPLHHGPTRGGRAEGMRYGSQYADTLAAYEAFFGTPDPSMWPSTAERFRRPERFGRVDREQVWIIRRPRLELRDALQVTVAVAVSMLYGAYAHAEGLGPLDLSGPQFLGLYAALGAAVATTTMAWRAALRRTSSHDDADLTPYELGWLAGEAQRCVEVAAADLLASEAAHVDAETNQLRLDTPVADLPWPLDVLAPVAIGDASLTDIGDELAALPKTLTARGLMLDDAAWWRAAAWPTALAVALAIFGTLKIMVGVSRDKPVGILVMFVVVTVFGALLAAANTSRRSRAGDKVLASTKAEKSRLVSAPRTPELPLAVALTGSAALVATPLAAWHALRFPVASGGGGVGDTGCSSGGDSGCGGGGCGGCSG